MNGQISIVRPGACDEREIRMIIRLAMGKTITALITPENLALALTGKSDLPIVLKLRNVEIKVKLKELSGNSPVTPDGWISCSERMPNDAQWCVVDAEDGYYVQCWSEGQGWLGDDISLRNCDVIRWLPIPEPPQQDGECAAS